MTGIWALAALWLGLALIASLAALSEIVVGTIAQLIIGAAIGCRMCATGLGRSWLDWRRTARSLCRGRLGLRLMDAVALWRSFWAGGAGMAAAAGGAARWGDSVARVIMGGESRGADSSSDDEL